MTAGSNLARYVMGAPAFSTASADALGQRPLTAVAIAALSQEVAAKLRESGLTSCEPVVLFISNEPNDLVGFFGIWLAGGVVAPIHVATPEPTPRALVARLGARFGVRAGELVRTRVRIHPAVIEAVGHR